MIGTKEGIYVYNENKIYLSCSLHQKCMWCGVKFKSGDDVVNAMYLTKEGFAWSGENIHRTCDELRYDATEKQIKLNRLYKMLN